ncbi:uracil-DNA glycosylase family protein [Verminephrobacter eiseniae]|nr:uracil-DNA glycosylase family protein [Verminephrobacter eiseniae]
MSLHLDARQRAMLQEMGITVWDPPQVAAAAPATVAATAAASAPAPAQPPAAATPVAERPRAGRRTSPAPARHGDAAAPPAAGATPVALTFGALKLHAAQALYPAADPAQTPAGLGSGWLIVAESLTPAEPLGGAAGRLLDNMLRAMQLHRHPRVFLAALERPGPGQPVSRHRSDVVGCAQPSERSARHIAQPIPSVLASDATPRCASMASADRQMIGDATLASADIPAALADTVAALQPALVLVLGHVAARAALGCTEPLGRLRAGPHQLAACPAVVSYDPAFLLRSPDTKAAAWADLCRALAMVRNAGAAR